MASKEQKKLLGIYQNIRKNVYGRNWPCMANNCSKPAINSHLLQKNGILDNLAEDGHLIQIKANDLFKIEDSGFAVFKTIGIDQVISYPLFCNEHDTAIFRPIEVRECDFSSQDTQLLFSYRALCAELRKKERDKEVHKRLLAANSFEHVEGFKNQTRNTLMGIDQGITDLSFSRENLNLNLRIEPGGLDFLLVLIQLLKCPYRPFVVTTRGSILRGGQKTTHFPVFL